MRKLSDKRYEYIKRIVIRTLRECGIKDIPIDPFEICKKRGYILIKYTDKYTKEEIAKIVEVYPKGFNYYHNGKRIIEYNDSHSFEIIRFTILHEIGHIELKHTEDCELAEAEAEWFAAYAIAPPPLVDLYNIEDFLDIVRIFKTSYECGFNCMRRYVKWKRNVLIKKDYEKELIKLFKDNCKSNNILKGVMIYDCN